MSKFELDTEFVRKLAAILEETKLGEIELADGDRRIRVARPTASVVQPAPVMMAGAPAAAAAPVVAVGGRMDGDGLDAHLAAGAVDTERDLAAVGDEDLVEHRHRGPYSTIISGSPNSTGRAFSIRTCMSVPALGALIGLNVFIASMISNVWPAVTLSPTAAKFGLPGSGAR